MTHDWRASKARFRAAMSGEQPDRVPLYMLVLEQMIARVQGITIRELFSTPKFYANSIINAHEFFHTDNLGLPTAYAGPAEVAALIKVGRQIVTSRYPGVSLDLKPEQSDEKAGVLRSISCSEFRAVIAIEDEEGADV